MGSLFKHPFAALALAFAALALAAGAGQPQSVMEARLGAERLVLQQHPAVTLVNNYVANGVHFGGDAALVPLATGGTTTAPATFGPTTGSPFLLVASCTGVSAGYSVLDPAASAASPIIGTVATCSGNGLTLAANATAAGAGGNVIIFASSAVVQTTDSGGTAISGTSLTLASGSCTGVSNGMTVIDSNIAATPVIGTISACASGVLTISAAAHAVTSGDHIQVATIVSPTTTAQTKIVGGNNSLLVNSCTGVTNGTSIIDSGYKTTPLIVGQALRTGSPCAGTAAPYLLTIDSSNGQYALTNAQPNDTIYYTGGIGSDSCHMVFSGWRRNATNTNNYLPLPFTATSDLVAGVATPNGGSSENIIGLDIVQDGTGLRFNVGDVNAVSSGTHEFTANVPIATQLTAAPWGQWVHILWSVNTCATNTQYTQVYLNGVQQTLTQAGNNSFATFNVTGIPFSSPAGVFILNGPAPGDPFGFGDWSDVELWTNIDLVCGAPSTSATGCLANNSISPADLHNFIDANGKPVAPSVRNAFYSSRLGASPLVQFTGPASQFVTNAGTATNFALIKATPSSSGWGGVTDITSSPSYASAANPSGQSASNPLGYKWACGVGQAGSNTYTGYSCGNFYAVNDLIFVAYMGAYSSAPGVTPVCTPASGWTSIDASSGYSSSGPSIFCLAYKVMTSASATPSYSTPNANDFSGFTLNGGTAPARGQSVITINYGKYNNGAAPMLDPAGAGPLNWAGNANITAAATPTLTYSNDLLVGIFATWTSNDVPFKCPAGTTKRIDASFGSAVGLFVCDMQLSGTTAGPLVGTQGNAYAGAGVLVPIHPN